MIAAIIAAALLVQAAAPAPASDCFAGPMMAFTDAGAQAPAATASATFNPDPNGNGRSMIAYGEITADSAAHLRMALENAQGIDEVEFRNLYGSDPAAAQAVAQVLRERRMAVRLPAFAICDPACADAFLGGVLRTADRNASIAFTRGPSRSELDAAPDERGREQVAARWAERRADMYIRAGISRGLLRLQLAGTSPSPCFMNRETMRRFNIINDEAAN